MLLTERAANAILWLIEFGKYMDITMKRRRRNMQRFCTAPGNTDAAGAAKFCVDNRFFPFCARHALTGITMPVQKSVFRTNASTNAAGNAPMNIHDMSFLRLTIDSENRAVFGTGCAADAVLRDEVRHMGELLLHNLDWK